MKRSGFTLVELIFAIVIIGVLAAVAVPKFKNLKQNAQAANIVKYHNDISDTAKLQYMNLTEAGGLASTAISLSDLYDFKGKEWTNKTGDFNTSSYITKVGGYDQNFTVAYTDGNVTMTMTVAASTSATEKASFKAALGKVMDFATNSDTNTTVLNLNAQ